MNIPQGGGSPSLLYSWLDSSGNRTSPPLSSLILDTDDIRSVDLDIKIGESLGLMIRGGAEYGLGIFVTGVEPGSAAERNGLKVGDQILEVHGRSLWGAKHDDAVEALKTGKHLSLVLRSVGKVPLACTSFSDPSFDELVSRPKKTITKIDSQTLDSIQILEEKAWKLLCSRDLSKLRYYRTEYLEDRMTVDALIAVVLELLDSNEKLSLLPYLRDIIVSDDLKSWDEAVLSELNGYHGQLQSSGFWENGIGTPSEDSGVDLANCGLSNQGIKSSGVHQLRNRRCTSQVSYSPPPKFEGMNETFEYTVNSRRHSNPVSLDTEDIYCETMPQINYLDKPRQSQSYEFTPELSENYPKVRKFVSCNFRQQHLQPPTSTVIGLSDGVFRITIKKTKPILGIAIEGGSNTKHQLPRIINIHGHGSAFEAGGLCVGHVILEVEGKSMRDKNHREAAEIIAEEFSDSTRDEMTFIVTEDGKAGRDRRHSSLIHVPQS